MTLCFLEKASNFSSAFLLLETVYLTAVLVTAILSKRKELIASTIITAVLLGSAVCPMFIVNHRGDRTFFTTFAILLCYALYLFRSLSTELNIKKGLKKAAAAAMPIAYVGICLVMLVLNAQNFGAYAFRADYIAEKMTETEYISVPYLAHERLTTEKTFSQIDPCLFSSKVTYTVISADEWEEAEEYKKITDSSPIEAIKYGLKSWKFKNPKYPQKLYEEYSLNT
jgi:Ca2+/Na+ antiporter